MSSDLKQEFLKNKYEYIPDEASNKPVKKAKKPKPKKSNHKHEYINIIIESYNKDLSKWVDNYMSYCPVCGKLDYFKNKDEIEKRFPNISIGMFGFVVSYPLDNKSEWQVCKDWVDSTYKHVTWKDFNPLKDKYIDLNMLDN